MTSEELTEILADVDKDAFKAFISTDLSAFATKEEIPELDGYAKKEDIDTSKFVTMADVKKEITKESLKTPTSDVTDNEIHISDLEF